ncbi:MAG: helix-turn-helix transcriptional regulator, partial [Gammaproteobacteria bacterium]
PVFLVSSFFLDLNEVTMLNHMRPIYPGERIRDEFEELGMSGNALALELRVPVNRVNDILASKRGICADTAPAPGPFSIPPLSFG